MRHAVGVEVDDDERADLLAYLRGELSGAKKTEVGRHVKSCEECQQLQREMRLFNRDAVAVIAPVPALFGAHVLAKRSSLKAATMGSGAGTGVFAQSAAAKTAAGITAALVTTGFFGVGVLAQFQPGDRDPASTPAVVSGQHGWPDQPHFSLADLAASEPPRASREPAPPSKSTGTSAATKSKPKRNRPRAAGNTTARTTTAPQPSRTTTTKTSAQPTGNDSNKPKPKKGSDCEFFCG